MKNGEVYKLVLTSTETDTVVPVLLDDEEVVFVQKLCTLIGLNANENAKPKMELWISEPNEVWGRIS